MAGLVLLLFWKLKGKAWGIALAVCVLSHWLLDALVHLPDLPLFHNSFKVGLGLWKFPWVAFVLEFLAFILAGTYLLQDYPRKKCLTIMVLLMSLGFAGMFYASEAEATPAAASGMSLSLYAIFTLMALWCDRGVGE